MVKSIREINKLIESHDIKAISVDIFDTLLLRSTLPELMRWRDYTRKQHKDLPPNEAITMDEFFMARLKIGKELYYKAKSSKGEYEVTFEELYKGVAIEALGYKGAQLTEFIARCLHIELETEFFDLRCNKELWNFLKEQKTQGRKIIFCSDMYLNRKSIELLMCRLMREKLLGELYVSSEWQKTKRDGTLFKVVIKRLMIAPEKILHIGDNLVADVNVPRSLGLVSYYYPRSNLWRAYSKVRERSYFKFLDYKNLLS